MKKKNLERQKNRALFIQPKVSFNVACEFTNEKVIKLGEKDYHLIIIFLRSSFYLF